MKKFNIKMGLSPTDYFTLEKLCLEPLKNIGAQLWLFGSRARGDFNKFSDIDILYEVNDTPKEILELLIYKIEQDLIESDLSYKVDLVNRAKLNPTYKEKAELEMLKF